MFLSRTLEDLNQEILEDLLVERDEILEALEDQYGVGDNAGELHRRLRELNSVFDEDTDQGEDDLIDKWEREFAEGRTPNFDED